MVLVWTHTLRGAEWLWLALPKSNSVVVGMETPFLSSRDCPQVMICYSQILAFHVSFHVFIKLAAAVMANLDYTTATMIIQLPIHQLLIIYNGPFSAIMLGTKWRKLMKTCMFLRFHVRGKL